MQVRTLALCVHMPRAPCAREHATKHPDQHSSLDSSARLWSPYMLQAAADTLALSSLEVDISGIEEGREITVKWRGKPVFIKHRTADEIAAQNAVPLSELKDPQTDAQRVVDPKVGFFGQRVQFPVSISVFRFQLRVGGNGGVEGGNGSRPRWGGRCGSAGCGRQRGACSPAAVCATGVVKGGQQSRGSMDGSTCAGRICEYLAAWLAGA